MLGILNYYILPRHRLSWRSFASHSIQSAPGRHLGANRLFTLVSQGNFRSSYFQFGCGTSCYHCPARFGTTGERITGSGTIATRLPTTSANCLRVCRPSYINSFSIRLSYARARLANLHPSSGPFAFLVFSERPRLPILSQCCTSATTISPTAHYPPAGACRIRPTTT